MPSDLPPSPDRTVIKKEGKEDTERRWFLSVFLGLLVVTIVVDLAGSAGLPVHAWTQLKPEVTDIRTYLFQVTGVIIGFYFGKGVATRRS